MIITSPPLPRTVHNPLSQHNNQIRNINPPFFFVVVFFFYQRSESWPLSSRVAEWELNKSMHSVLLLFTHSSFLLRALLGHWIMWVNQLTPLAAERKPPDERWCDGVWKTKALHEMYFQLVTLFPPPAVPVSLLSLFNFSIDPIQWSMFDRQTDLEGFLSLWWLSHERDRCWLRFPYLSLTLSHFTSTHSIFGSSERIAIMDPV